MNCFNRLRIINNEDAFIYAPSVHVIPIILFYFSNNNEIVQCRQDR